MNLENDSADPARLYSFSDNKGVIGFIPSITEPFCQNCDRIRITSEGKVHTCLFDKKGYDLKKLIQEGKSDEDIKKIEKIILQIHSSFLLLDGNFI